MPQAYNIVLVTTQLFDHDRQDTIRAAQREADKKFEELAISVRKTLVTRDPEPRVMSVPELQQQFPHADLDGLIGLYFTADIS